MNQPEKNKSASLSSIIGDKIIKYIIDNNLEPGDRLPTEYELVELLGASRSTVREAVRRLVARNILVVKQGSGTFVSKQMGIPEDPLGLAFMHDDTKLVIDLIDVRLMLEPEIAALAALNASDRQIVQLAETHEMVGKVIESGADHSEADANFHRLLAVFSGNSALTNLIPIITSSINAAIGGTNDGLRLDVQEQHGYILEAVQRHDPIGARNTMISHLSSNREYIIRNRK